MAVISTGWKQPTSVSQHSKDVNKGHTCYPWSDLKDILKNDFHYAYIPTSGGIDSLRASAYIYAYNYNFKIPANATIKKVSILPVIKQANGKNYGKVMKVKLLRLKIGSSTSDMGMGKDLAATQTYIENYRVPFSWTDESSWKYNNKYAFEGTPAEFEVNLTPAIVNSTNFGCVFQVVGTGLKKWVMPGVAKLMMKVEYDTSTLNTKKTENVKDATTMVYEIRQRKRDANGNIIYENGNPVYVYETVTFEQGVSKKEYLDLEIDNKNQGVIIRIHYQHTGSACTSPIVTTYGNQVLSTPKKTSTYTMPTIHFGNDTKMKTYTQELSVFPNYLAGTHSLELRTPIDSKLIRFNIKPISYTTMGAVEKKKYLEDGQFCFITNSSFNRNKATSDKVGKGGAMYILTEHFKQYGNRYGKNDGPNNDNRNIVGSTNKKESKLVYNNREIG